MEQVIKNVAEVVLEESLITTSTIPGDIIEAGIDNALCNFEHIKDFIDCALGSQEEADMKKLFAKAVIIAQDQGVLPPALACLPKDPVAIASLVDESLTRIKTAAMADAEKLYPEEALNVIIDRTAARMKVASDILVAKGISTATEAAIQAVSYVFPPVQMVAPAIRTFTQQCVPTVQKAVRKGIDLVASTAKKVVKKIGVRAIEKAQKVGRAVLSFLGL